jgi:hypothetical protein
VSSNCLESVTLFIIILFSFNRACYSLVLRCVPLVQFVIFYLSVSVLPSRIVNRVVIIFGFTESSNIKICYFYKSTVSHPSTLSEHLASLNVIWHYNTPASDKPVLTSGGNCMSLWGSPFLYLFLYLLSNKCSVIVKNICCMMNKSCRKSQVTLLVIIFSKNVWEQGLHWELCVLQCCGCMYGVITCTL